jgi:peptidoglycan/LPS O-acetylase OafA/YrhL
MQSEKLVELEAVRGIAAIVVLVHHFLLGFMPQFHGLFFPHEAMALFGTPFFAFVNGSAAVVLFFVLSGFVLTYRSFADRSVSGLAIGALKRWPRLALPVVTVNLLSALLLAGGLYVNQSTAALSGSRWLAWFFGPSPYAWPHPVAAAYEGLFATFLGLGSFFNSSLWTMYFELFGSFLAFALALAVLLLHRRLVLPALLSAAAVSLFLSPYFFCFVVGVALARLFTSPAWQTWVGWFGRDDKWRRLRLGAWAAAAVFLFGYQNAFVTGEGPVGVYRFLAPISAAAPLATSVALQTIAAVMVLAAVLALPGLRRSLGGRAGALLGGLSFPIYLLHLPVLCSVGAATYSFLLPRQGSATALVLTLLVTLLVTLLAAVPLMRLDRRWVGILRAGQGKLLGWCTRARGAAAWQAA